MDIPEVKGAVSRGAFCAGAAENEIEGIELDVLGFNERIRTRSGRCSEEHGFELVGGSPCIVGNTFAEGHADLDVALAVRAVVGPAGRHRVGHQPGVVLVDRANLLVFLVEGADEIGGLHQNG